MKSIAKILAVISLLFIASNCEPEHVRPPVDPNDPETTDIPELVITKYDGGNVEWVSIQKGTSADAKVADAKQDRNDIRQSNDTLYIQLLCVDNDTVPFTQSGNFTVVLKHDQKDKMYIKTGAKFTDGLADLKWGGWLPINAK